MQADTTDNPAVTTAVQKLNIRAIIRKNLSLYKSTNLDQEEL